MKSRIVNLAYIRRLYAYLFGIPDDELEENFDMDRPEDRSMFFREANREFQSLSPKTQSKILEAIEYVLSVPRMQEHWRQIIPHDLPIDVFTDRREYLRSLFKAVSGKEPREDVDTSNVIIEYELDAGWYLK